MGAISGAAGIQSALGSFDYSAATINRSVADGPDAPSTSSDLVNGMVGMGLSAIDVRAGVALIRTQDQMLGTLVDMLA